jgi:hypothetical protein
VLLVDFPARTADPAGRDVQCDARTSRLEPWARHRISHQAGAVDQAVGVVPQPPEAKTGRPIDVSAVTAIAFAPQDDAAGQLAIGHLFVSR